MHPYLYVLLGFFRSVDLLCKTARYVRGANIPRRVFIMWYKHGQEPVKLHKLSQLFLNHFWSKFLLIFESV